MTDPHLGIGDAHAAQVRGHHQFIVAVRTAGQEHLLTEFNGFFPMGLAETVEISAGKGFHTVDITVHPRIEILVLRHAGCQFRIHHDLIKHRVIGIQPQFFFGTRQYGGSGHFGSGARKGRNPHMINGRIFDEVPPLVIHRRTGIGQHQ